MYIYMDITKYNLYFPSSIRSDRMNIIYSINLLEELNGNAKIFCLKKTKISEETTLQSNYVIMDYIKLIYH